MLRHGDGPGRCDVHSARDISVHQDGGTFFMNYDGAGHEGWLACLGRNGIADDGRGSYSRVHYEQQQGIPLANANWQDGCFCMSYGDGADGQHPVTSLDIAAHEMTHGVTSATAGLGDTGESPALNEAVSDMMAAAVEFYANNPNDVPDYTMAELDDLHGDGKPIRYMDLPSKAGVSSVGYAPLDYWTPKARTDEGLFSSPAGTSSSTPPPT